MAVETLTKPLDRWDLIAERVYGVPDLAWAIAEANPALAGDLVLPAGITLNVPEINTLRRPLTAANPAREDDGDFLPLPADDSPAPIVQTGGGVAGNFVPLEAVGVTVAPLFNGVVPVGHLPPYPTLASLNGLSAEVINTALALKVDTSTYTAAIALKADASAVATALGFKADASAVATALGLKVDTSTYTAGLGTKVDISTYTAAIALKADASAVATALGLKVDTSTYTAGLGTKVDTSTYTAGLALKADATALTSGLALKLDTATRNAANGVAGLDSSSLIAIAQIPLTAQFTLQPRTSGAAVDFNTQAYNHAAIRWMDSNVSHTNNPVGTTTGALEQKDPLYLVSGATNLYKLQTFYNYGHRVWDRYQSNGTWATWNERTYLNRSQSFTAIQEFAASATFKAGSTPAVTTSLVQAGVDASGNPRYWLVNANATAGNRLKSITITANGNIQFRHHADDGTDGNVLEHTASGNVLTNGTLRSGSGTTNFTGASFVPGALYFRSDITGDSGVGTLTYSDGSIWRRIRDGSPVTVADNGLLTTVITGTTSGSQGGTVTVAHGLTGTKIRSVSGVIYHASGQTVPFNSRQSTYASVCATDATNFSLTNESANSASILSKTFYAVIDYIN